MDMNARLKRIAAMLVAVILVLQVAPAGTANESVERHTIYSEWWRPNPNPDPNPKTPTAEYTFSGVGDTVLLPFLLGLNGIHGIITDVVTDSAAVELDDSLYLKAVSYFDSAELTVTVNNKTYVFILHNPEKEPAIPAGTEVTGDNGSFIAAGAVPAGTKLVVGSFEPTEKLLAAVPAEDEKTTVVWMDIGLMSPDGEDVHAGAEVHVRTQIGLPAVPEVNGFTGQAVIRDTRLYHVIGEEEVEELPVKVDTENGAITALHFTAESFSGFALSYTVDFHYILDGDPREISFSGGGAVSLTGLVNDLGLYSAAGFGTAADFMAEVDNAAFSNPSLVWVGKTAAETTVGALKDANGLNAVYSGELTEADIAAINAQTVQAGDWALISLMPFDTEEQLILSMRDGKQFTVRVTDAQIKKRVIDSRGDTWEIIVTYEEDAQIPDGSELRVREILEGTDEYERWYGQAIEALAKKDEEDDYLVGLNFARFFDVEIIGPEGQDIEPAVPVRVEIRYVDPVELAESDQLKVVHFAKTETEIIPIETAAGSVTKIVYEQNGFSVIGTVAETNAYGWPTVNNGQYVLLLQDGEDYYAVSHDGTLRKVYYLNGTVAFMGPGTTSTDYLNEYLWTYEVASIKNHTGRLSTYGTDPASYIDPYYGVLNPESPNAVIGSAKRVLNISNGKIYANYHNTSYTLSADGGNLHRTTLTAEDASPIYFANIASFTADSSESELYDFIDINVLINKWKKEMTQDLVVDKTAEVYDYANRIYQVDLMASSGYHLISPALALEFVVDASRSMFFPENLHRVQVNGSDVTYTNIAGLRTFFNNLNENQRDTTFYVITDKDNAATNWAIFYHDARQRTVYRNNSPMASGWYYIDAAYYFAPDNINSGYPVTGGMCYPLSDDYLVRKTLNDKYIYTADEKVEGRPWTRLDYMQIAVEAAAKVLFAVDPEAQIGLVTFNKNTHSYGPYTAEQSQTLINALYNIGLDGGTRHADGLNKAVAEFRSGFTNVNNCQTAVVLITDGAPNGNTWDQINSAAASVRGMTNAFGQPTRLFTLGLSLENVGENKDKLANISSEPHSDFAFSAEQSTEVVHFITKIIEGLTIDADLYGHVTDVIDAAFYPVNPATGMPLTSGTWITAEGEVTAAGAEDAAGRVIYEAGSGSAEGSWKVEWLNQQISWPTYKDSAKTQIDTHGWNGRVYVKAQEDFLGGNDIKTNETGSQVEALQYINRNTHEAVEISGGDAEKIEAFDTPYVNVDELLFDENSTEWTVYLGESVDPKTQLESLLGEINVYEVVKDGGSLVYTLRPNDTTNETDKKNKEEQGKTFPLSTVIGSLSDTDWSKLTDGETVEIDYEAYGHEPGVITLSLKQTVADGEDDLTPSPHNTAETGNEVEKYVLTVTYAPYSASIANYHTGNNSTGSHGADTDDIVSENGHIINVYARPLEIEKINQDGEHLGGATFKLYRVDDENGEAIEALDKNHRYAEVAAATSNAQGLARLKDSAGKDFYLVKGETYYLIETDPPQYYARDNTVRKVEVETEGGKFTDLSGRPINSMIYPFNWDQDVRIKAADGYFVLSVLVNGRTTEQTDFIPHDNVAAFQYRAVNTPVNTLINIPVVKVLQGRDMKAGEFSFVLRPIDIQGNPGDSGMQMISNPAGAQDEEVTFWFNLHYSTESILANAPYHDTDGNAVFFYLVYEMQGNLENVIYSDLQYIVRVTLTQDENDDLVATPKYYLYDGEGTLPDDATENLQQPATQA